MSDNDFNEPDFNEPDFNEPDFNEPDSDRLPPMNWPGPELEWFSEALRLSLKNEEQYQRTIRALAYIIRNHSSYAELNYSRKPMTLRTFLWGLGAFLFALWFIHVLIVSGMDVDLVSDCVCLSSIIAVVYIIAEVLMRKIQANARPKRE